MNTSQCVSGSGLLHQRVAGGRGNTALVVLVARHEDVTLDAPRRAPAVLHNPVVIRALGAVADSQHTVVQLGAVNTVIQSVLTCSCSSKW